MSLNFEKYAEKGNEMLNVLSEDLQVPQDKAGRILRAVLHAIRNRISIDESLQFISQLPMVLKGVYVDQWNPWHSFHRIHHLSEFISEVRKYDKNVASYDFGNEESAKKAIKAVFRTLSLYVSEGEMRQIISVLPGELKIFANEVIGNQRMIF